MIFLLIAVWLFLLVMNGRIIYQLPFWVATKKNRLMVPCDPVFDKPRIWVPLASFSISQREEMIELLPLITIHKTGAWNNKALCAFCVLHLFFSLCNLNLMLSKTVSLLIRNHTSWKWIQLSQAGNSHWFLFFALICVTFIFSEQ